MVDPYTGTPLWDGSPPDLGLAVEWFLTKTCKQPPVAPLPLAGSAVGHATFSDP